jgi:ApaG protein
MMKSCDGMGQFLRQQVKRSILPRPPPLIRNFDPPHLQHTMSHDSRYQIKVSTVVRYLPEQSDPAREQYVFAYTITIENTGSVAAKLLSRHWIITDAHQQVQEVRGAGVIGEQPVLSPGQSFEYTSGCPLETPVGTMRGSYQMEAADGTRFEAEIAEFILAMPRVLH